VSGVWRYPADILTGVRGLEVPGRYPDRCQGYAGVPATVMGFAGILATVRGLQVPGRYPYQSQGFAGTRQIS